MPPRRILLTGGTGFVGRHLQAALAASYPEADIAADWVDLRDREAVEAMVAAAGPDVCVHLAAIATVAAARQDAETAWAVNLHGSLRLADALLRYAPACQMLFVSSADCYGGSQPGGGPIGEDAPLAPRNLYAATKAAADLALGAMVAEGLRLVRVRPFNHTGAGQSADLVISAFARQIALIAAGQQAPSMRVGNLDSWRDFLDVHDVCAAYVACIERRDQLAPGTIINIGSGQPRRIGDILAEMLAVAGVAARIETDPVRFRASEHSWIAADTRRAAALLGWAPAVPWSTTLADVLDDWRERVRSG